MLIDIEFTDDLSNYPNAIAVVSFEAWPGLTEVDEIRRRILRLYPDTDKYTVRVEVSTLEWGASAGDVMLAISLAANLVQLWQGIRSVFDWATRKHQETLNVDSDTAERSARLTIATKWPVSASGLHKLNEAETRQPRGWTFRFEDDQKLAYEATLEATKTGIPTTYVAVDWGAIGGAPKRPESPTRLPN